MPQKKETTSKNKTPTKNTSYYRSRVGVQKQKKESSVFLERAKKRQIDNYRLAIIVLLILMAVFTAIIALGIWLNSLVDSDGGDDNSVITPKPSVYNSAFSLNGEDDDAFNSPTTADDTLPVIEIAEIFYNYNGVYLDIQKIDGLDGLQYIIDAIKLKGINAVNIDIKKEDGTVPFPLNGHTAAVVDESNYISMPIAEAINLLHENGLYVSGVVSCFKDHLAASNYPLRALDSAAASKWEDETGRWLNPYLEESRNYIKSIVEDSAALGFDEIILSWFFFPYASSSNPVSYNEDTAEISKYTAVKDFVTDIRYTLDDIAPKIKLGLNIPLGYFLNVPDESMGLNPVDLIDKCNFLATSFAPSHVLAGYKIDGNIIANPENDPNGTVKSLCGHFNYIIDNPSINFRPYIQAFNGYGDDQIAKQKQALFESNIKMWQLVNPDNNY